MQLQYRQTGKDLLVTGLADCLLDDIFLSGQAFRFDRIGESWSGVARGTALVCRQAEPDSIVFYETTREVFASLWSDYFDLSSDYSRYKALFCTDLHLQKAVSFAPGIRILRQDLWEALCSFIISQNNHIPRIKQIIARLCTYFGEPLGQGRYDFPGPQRLALLDEAALEPLRCGFRARYLLDAARKVANGDVQLRMLGQMNWSDARCALKTIVGVGDKVADCVLLYGGGKKEVFPVDTWIKKVLALLYQDGFPQAFAPAAGIAQQYLFYYARCHKEAFGSGKSA